MHADRLRRELQLASRPARQGAPVEWAIALPDAAQVQREDGVDGGGAVCGMLVVGRRRGYAAPAPPRVREPDEAPAGAVDADRELRHLQAAVVVARPHGERDAHVEVDRAEQLAWRRDRQHRALPQHTLVMCRDRLRRPPLQRPSLWTRHRPVLLVDRRVDGRVAHGAAVEVVATRVRSRAQVQWGAEEGRRCVSGADELTVAGVDDVHEPRVVTRRHVSEAMTAKRTRPSEQRQRQTTN